MVTYSYSTDNEHFYGDFETPEAAAEECFINYSDVDNCYVGINCKYSAHEYVDIRYLLEKIGEEAESECGESAIDWLDGIKENKEKRNELAKIIGDFLEAHDPVTFFRVHEFEEYQRPDELDFSVGGHDGS